MAVAPRASQARVLAADPPKICPECEAWNRPVTPFRIFGNTYYVGVDGLSVLLVTSEAGHILLDAALPQSVPLIDASIRALGFRTSDIRLIVNSHAHHDHAGGINALERATGAEVAASPAGAPALEAGMPTPDDPQYAFGRDRQSYPPVRRARVVRDGEILRVGPLAITAHLTPGHTPGSTTWSWRSCEGSRCLDIVYADSLSAVSAPGFRFSGGDGRPSLVETFRRSIDRVAHLPCDIVISTHPGATRLFERRARRVAGGANPFVDPQGCRVYAERAREALEKVIASEK